MWTNAELKDWMRLLTKRAAMFQIQHLKDKDTTAAKNYGSMLALPPVAMTPTLTDPDGKQTVDMLIYADHSIEFDGRIFTPREIMIIGTVFNALRSQAGTSTSNPTGPDTTPVGETVAEVTNG